MIDVETRRRTEFRRLTATLDDRLLDQVIDVLAILSAGGDPSAIIVEILGEEDAAPVLAEIRAARA